MITVSTAMILMSRLSFSYKTVHKFAARFLRFPEKKFSKQYVSMNKNYDSMVVSVRINTISKHVDV